MAGRTTGEFNLGVAHGVPGVIGILGMLSRAGVDRAKTEPILRSAIGWLLAQAIKDDAEGHCFPYSAGADILPEPARLAWCYGVPGIAGVLSTAADGLGDEALASKARELARAGARCGIAASGVRDACLCHGAAGVGHIYNRLFNSAQDDTLRKTAIFWFEQTLEMRRPGEGGSGFQGVGLDEDGEERFFPCIDFLNGSAGIGLALLAAATPVRRSGTAVCY